MGKNDSAPSDDEGVETNLSELNEELVRDEPEDIPADTSNLPPLQRLEQEVNRCWPIAQNYWSRFLLLTDPDISQEIHSVAQIGLSTRQVSLNSELIVKYNLFDCVEALLAHEVVEAVDRLSMCSGQSVTRRLGRCTATDRPMRNGKLSNGRSKKVGLKKIRPTGLEN